MKNIKMFEGFLNENDFVKPRNPNYKNEPCTLVVSFGPDQVSTVEGILNQLKKEKQVSSFASQKASQGGDLVGYIIEFNSAYGAYLFGHMQGAAKHF